MDNNEVIKLARQHLDLGLNFSRTVHITRATDAELLNFAKALLTHFELHRHGADIETYMAVHYPDII